MTTERPPRRKRVTARQRRDLLRRQNRDASRLEREFARELVEASEALSKAAAEAAKAEG